MAKYQNKIIVAPMVRVSTLPFRLLCLDYGADLVYTEENIDFKMLRTKKIQNDLLGTIDFIDKTDGTVIFRTSTKEKNNLIYQMGTCNAQRALQVAKLIENFVSGIDINMGCPKEFSIKGGMGAALLTQHEKVKEILTTLVQNLSIPVTCKIRILPSIEETLNLCKLIESCGVAAIAVHGRTRDERPRNPNHNDVIRIISQSLSIPVIANGGSKTIENFEGIKKFQVETSSSSVMIARAAMWNCSILRKEGLLPINNVVKSFLKYCIDYDNAFTFTKYTIQNMLRDLQTTDRGKAFLETQTLQEMCCLWDLKEYFNEAMRRRSDVEGQNDNVHFMTCLPNSIDEVNISTFDEFDKKVVEMNVQFIRGNFAPHEVPKMVLNRYIYKHEFDLPIFVSKSVEKLFASEVQVNGVIYRSTLKEKSKKFSEQGAALVCLHALKLVGKSYGFIACKGTRKYANFTSKINVEKLENEENYDSDNFTSKINVKKFKKLEKL